MPRIEQKVGKEAKKAENPALSDENEPEIQVSGEDSGQNHDEPSIDGVEELRKQLKAEKEARQADREARIEAERRANESQRAAYDARAEIAQSNETLIDSSIERLTQESAILKREYASAIASGDHQRAADINERWIDRRNDLKVLQQGKEAMAEERAKPKAPPQPIASGDLADQFAAALKGPSRDWVLQHRDHADTRSKQQAIIGAHNIAVARGHEADSPGYFAEVERVLGITPSRGRTNDVEDDEDESPFSAAAAPIERRAAPSAAPVSRSGGPPGAPSPRTVRLSKAEAEAAEASGITHEEYWRNKQRAIKAGEISTRH